MVVGRVSAECSTSHGLANARLQRLRHTLARYHKFEIVHLHLLYLFNVFIKVDGDSKLFLLFAVSVALDFVTMAQGEQPVDLDALQAQIDLSMSLTEELVSSWISASPKISKGSNVNGFGSNAPGPFRLRAHEKLEKELQEYMKRPPRYVHVVNLKFSLCIF